MKIRLVLVFLLLIPGVLADISLDQDKNGILGENDLNFLIQGVEIGILDGRTFLYILDSTPESGVIKCKSGKTCLSLPIYSEDVLEQELIRRYLAHGMGLELNDDINEVESFNSILVLLKTLKITGKVADENGCDCDDLGVAVETSACYEINTGYFICGGSSTGTSGGTTGDDTKKEEKSNEDKIKDIVKEGLDKTKFSKKVDKDTDQKNKLSNLLADAVKKFPIKKGETSKEYIERIGPKKVLGVVTPSGDLWNLNSGGNYGVDIGTLLDLLDAKNPARQFLDKNWDTAKALSDALQTPPAPKNPANIANPVPNTNNGYPGKTNEPPAKIDIKGK